MKLVILAGGTGTRLWPVSRKETPKQIKPIIGGKTLLAKTYERLRSGFAAKDIHIATNINQVDLIKEQLPNFPKRNYIAEPSKKDTAAAIGLAAVYLSKKNPKEIFININSDHFVKNEKEYLRVIGLTEKAIRKYPDTGILIGVKPTYPETGLGYIQMGEQLCEFSKTKIFKIACFKEKPDLKTAAQYVAAWEYLWNLGCFVWRVDTLLDLYRRFLPDMYKILMRIKKAIGTDNEAKVLKREFSKIDPISIDYGIIERAPKLAVVPADFGWADIGNWRTVKDILSVDRKKNIKKGKVLNIDCEDNLVYNYSEKLTAMVGVKGMVVINNEDVNLICPKDKAQDVKKIVKKLKNTKKLNKYL